ncbi:hypothetical protein BDV95DRAFT_297977 [Massariosphaeria phaeospora]|uniref:Aflatoxin biosynthesis ketoreductase nor-1 n=1 Tax=Massariosphaeria phaeospora TaxID=100035 RepID=A0A7C8IAK2_9PLEO|nr:hypothetical protein BDV95DRAFT_297977 [Massariosphaeria phaeospora]
MSGKTYLITGANRGLGHGLFALYAARPNNTIIAAVRSVSAAQGLLDVPRGANTRVVLVQIDSSSRTDAYTAIDAAKAQGVTSIDVVISAAGIMKLNTLEAVPLEEFEEVLLVNGISVLLLYKAALPLLRASAVDGGPRFAFVSAAGGSISAMDQFDFPIGAHGATKAMANYLVRKMGCENEWLTTVMVNPGLVQTDMGNLGAREFMGKELALRTVEESCADMAHIIDNATKAEHSGKFFDETIDRIFPW